MMGNLAFLEKKAVVVGGGIQPFRAAVAVPFPQLADIMVLHLPQAPACCRAAAWPCQGEPGIAAEWRKPLLSKEISLGNTS